VYGCTFIFACAIDFLPNPVHAVYLFIFDVVMQSVLFAKGKN